MGLTLFAYAAAIFMLLSISRVKSRGSSAVAFRIAGIANVASVACLATGYLLAYDFGALALPVLRAAGALTVVVYLALLRLALGYPYAKRMLLVDIAFAAIAIAATWALVFTDAYLVEVRRFTLEFVRFEGVFHWPITVAVSGVGTLAAIVMIVRASMIQSRVYRQHLFLMGAAIAVSVAWGSVIVTLAPVAGFMTLYPLSAAGGLLCVMAGAYAFSSTRVFQIKSVAKSLASWTVVAAGFGLPLGLAVSAVFLFRTAAPLTAVLGAAVIFAIVGHWAESFARGRFGSGRDEEARELLQAQIAHIDLSAGRAAVLGELSAIMGEAFGCSWLSVLSEDDTGGLRSVYPDDNDAQVSVPGSPIMEALTAVDRLAILKTDLVADQALAEHKAALLGFFEALGAEAVILAKEGRRIVGVFVFGPKRSGGDYDGRDYAAFDAIHGKLFVIAYYARHVARESLLETVEQEIGLADQIVRSVQEHIDPIDHPGVEVAFKCESPRGLGGDLFDSVRISEHRWFFVVGDVSGKGLNASMSMVILKSMVRTLLKEEKDFVKLVSKTNTFIKERLPRGTFFSGLFGFLALDKGSIYFINCGIPAMFFRSTGLDSVIEAQGDGKMLGFVKNIEPFLKTRKLVLPPGSRVLITTDGIVEAESVRGERYGKERLVRILGENKSASAAETVDAVIKSASAFTGGRLDDDITVVAIDYSGYAKEKKQ